MPDNMRSAMTLVELLIAIAILGILSALALPRVQAFQNQAHAVAAATSMQSIAKAAMHYQLETGDWPKDKSRRVIPPELLSYLPNTDFTRAPLGGVWDYEDWRGKNISAGGDTIAIAISIVEGDETLYQLVDQEVDDGNLATGLIRLTDRKPRLVYIIELE